MASKRAAAAEARVLGARSEWIVCHCDGHRFGVPVDGVREIVRGRPVVRLPGCGSGVHGLVNLRGRLLTVIDLGAALGLRASAGEAGHRFLVVEQGDRRVGLAVEGVHGLTARIGMRPRRSDGEGSERAGLAVPPAVLEAFGESAEHVLGIGEWRGEPFVALDPAAVVGRFFV
ncbi:MAG: chemotaxis protein CheW [Gemmatimonadota bacterium]